jgi:hypothetical protein
VVTNSLSRAVVEMEHSLSTPLSREIVFAGILAYCPYCDICLFVGDLVTSVTALESPFEYLSQDIKRKLASCLLNDVSTVVLYS